MAEEVYYDDVLVTNMKVLGYRGDLQDKTFWHYNPKAFHDVMYFLFCKLDPDKTKQSFRDCWPVCGKKDEAAFRRVCNAWIGNIVKEDKCAQFPGHIGPLLISPHGRKFVRFMVKFSCYVMHKGLMRLGGPRVSPNLNCPTVDPENVQMFNMAKAVLITAAGDSTASYISYQERRLKEFQAWKAYMNTQVGLYRNLTKDLDAAKKKMNELLAERERYLSSSSWTQQSRGEAIQKISACWNKLTEISKTNDAAWEVVSSLLSGDIDRHCLAGDELKVEIPDVLLERAEELGIQQEDLDGLVKDDVLDLVKFTKFAQAAIQLYVQKLLLNNPFSELEKMTATVEEECKRYTFIMERLEKLKLELITKKDQLLASTAAHTDEILAGITMADIENLPGEIVPPTPPLNIYGGVALSFGSPIQTPRLTPPSSTISESSPDLKPQYSATPLSRKFPRSCSPLLYDPLCAPAEQQSNGLLSSQQVVSIGVKKKKQWTKVTTTVKSSNLNVPVKGGASSGSQVAPKTRMVDTKKVACNVVKPTKASGAIPKVTARTSAIPVARTRVPQTVGNRYVQQAMKSPGIAEIPAEKAFTVQELLPRTPASTHQAPPITPVLNAGQSATAAVSPCNSSHTPKPANKFDAQSSFELELLKNEKIQVVSPGDDWALDANTTDHGAKDVSVLAMYPEYECSVKGRASSTPIAAASRMDEFLGSDLDDFVKAIEDEGDSLLIGNEDTGSLANTDDDWSIS